jgi:hypothetical protein
MKVDSKYSWIISALIPVQLFIIMPLALFVNNSSEVGASIFSVLKLCMVPAAAALLLTVALLKMLSLRYKKVVINVIASISILIWLQANVLVWDYGLLDGKAINWQNFQYQGWVDIAVWLLVSGLFFMLYKKQAKGIPQVAVALLLVQVITLTISLIEEKDELVITRPQSSVAELEKIHQFSTQQNVIHLLVDGFQADVFDFLMQDEQVSSKYQSAFQGFTFYKENLGTFPYTRFAMPSFISGAIYKNKQAKEEFISQQMRGQNILNAAKNNGFALDIAASGNYFVNQYANTKVDHLYALDAGLAHSPELVDALRFIDLSIFRSSPQILKKSIYNDQQWFFSALIEKNKEIKYRYFKHTAFMLGWVDAMEVIREEPVYKYIHIMNTHNPMVVDARCRYAGKVLGTTRETLTMQSKCTMDTLSLFLDELKAKGIYETSLIIIHGDHGGWVGNLEQTGEIIFDTGVAAPHWLASLASPLLAIKLPNEKSAYQVSDKLTSLQQLPATIADILQFKESFPLTSIYKEELDPAKQRFFNFYGWQRDAWETDYTGPIQVFSITGSHYTNDWQPAGLYLPPNDKSQ